MIEYLFIMLAVIFAYLYANSPKSTKTLGASLRIFFLSGVFFMSAFAFLSVNLNQEVSSFEKNIAVWGFYGLLVLGIFFMFALLIIFVVQTFRKTVPVKI